jgi:hypothetical protein
MFPARRYSLIFFGSQGQEPFGLRVMIPLLLALQSFRTLSDFDQLAELLGRLQRSLLVQTVVPEDSTGTTQLNDRLTMSSLAHHLDKLKRAGGPAASLIVFDVCCMATVEVLYELRDVTEWLVAAPYPVGAPKRAPVRTWLQNWIARRTDSTRTIAQIAARDLSAASAHHPMLAATTEQAGDFSRALADLVEALLGLQDDDFTQLVTMARTKRVGLMHHVQTYDLATFVSALNENPQTPANVRNACGPVLSDLSRRLEAIHVSTDDECVYGGQNMTIYFPSPPTPIRADYSQLALVSQPSTASVKWPKFLNRFHSLVGSIAQRDCTGTIWE